MIRTFCPPSMVMVNSLASRYRSGCQIAVRVVVRGLLSERVMSEWLLSEWLLSESLSGWSAINVTDSSSPFVGTCHLYISRASKKTTMRSPRRHPKPSRANPETQTETKTVNRKERSQTQETTQKEQQRIPKNGKYRKITN